MPVNEAAYLDIKGDLDQNNVTLVAVSKTKPVEDIMALFRLGHLDFGENYVQELVDKVAHLPKTIRWHFIGHLQTNKVKYIAPFVQLIQGVDSLKLLKEINKQAGKMGRVIDCLLQVHIAREETKFGLDEKELEGAVGHLSKEPMPHVRVIGLMGMASFTGDLVTVREEFQSLKKIFERVKTILPGLTTLSMGMSSDYRIAVEEGSTMVRIGSLLFGERDKS